MKAKILVYALPALILATVHLAMAQQPTKIPRIGYLSTTSASANSPRVKPFQDGLRELGYVEGKTLSLNGDMQREIQIVCPHLRPS